MKYSLTSSHHLKGYQQLYLDHAEGNIEGLSVVHPGKDHIKANRHPQALCLTVHPSTPNIYFVGTDEGCLFTCSTNHPHQHISILQAHRGSIYSIEYSPWSPKIFLTCGSDWLGTIQNNLRNFNCFFFLYLTGIYEYG
jgi:dynein intermediate chain 4, axonemal